MVNFHTATPAAYPDGFLIGTHGSLIITIIIIIMLAINMMTMMMMMIKKGCLSWARSQLVFVTGSVTAHSVATYV